jgi:hypothetical protein
VIETPWDQRLARLLVKPLAGVPGLSPNHILSSIGQVVFCLVMLRKLLAARRV